MVRSEAPSRIGRFPSLTTLALFPKASLPFTVGIGWLLVLSVLGTLVQMFVFGGVVNAIAPAAREGLGSEEGRRLLFFLILSGVLNIAIGVVAAMQSYLVQRFRIRFQLFLEQLGMRAALDPSGIAHMEDPEFLNQFDLALGIDRFGGPANASTQIIYLLQIRLTAIGSAVLLIGLAWWAPALILLAATFGYRWLVREMDLIYSLAAESTEDSRRALYFRDLAVSPESAKEVRVFGLANWLSGLYASNWTHAMSRIWRERRKLTSQMILAGITFAAAYALLFVTMANRALSGAITVGAVAVYAQAAFALIRLVQEGSPIYLARGAANAIQSLVSLPQLSKRLSPALKGTISTTEALPQKEVRFEGVRFGYPGVEREVIEGLDLEIPVGRSLAIVGTNGAGKTTLIKLLARLYDPNAGRITVDGLNLKDIEPAEWHRRVAVIFQDFVRFPFSARDNVGFGDLEQLRNDRLLEEAGSFAGADQLIHELPQGWDTVLSKQLRGGVDLSGGQWQKIALARAMVAAKRSGILILDEPTANLDVRAEAEIFERFLEFTKGLTTILISHRFSSVRHADRICVLEGGVIVEEGTHDELIDRRGRYQQMFSLQAARFESEREVRNA